MSEMSENELFGVREIKSGPERARHVVKMEQARKARKGKK